MFGKGKYSLLLSYIFLYPAYYVVAMLLATLILTPLMGWSFESAKKYFLVLAIAMSFASYIIHFRILVFALNDLNKKSK